MERTWESKMVYRVWYGPHIEHEAFFTEKKAAEDFAKLVNGRLNVYKWEMQIEE